MDRGKLKNPLAALGKYKYALLVAGIGALLLLWPAGRQAAEKTLTAASGEGNTSVAETERRLEEILGKISGVGRVEVMLTLQSGSELVLAQDSTLRYSGSAQAPDDYQRSTDTVTDSGGVVVTREVFPQFRGALVVCDGGSSDGVRLQVINAVSALTGLGADRVAVVQWQGGGGE